MLGREPMNPRAGQFGLAREASQWTRWTEAPPRARRILRATYRGWEPRAYGRLGSRQWRAPLPGTRIIVKDPFALLSVAAVVEATGAVPVVVYRRPEAVLASYRRMGWRADVAEFMALGATIPAGSSDDDVAAMAAFWTFGYETVLDDLDRAVPGAVVVSHEELTRGGASAQRVLLDAIGLDRAPVPDPPDTDGGNRSEVRQDRLHNLERSPEEVMSGWQERITEPEGRMLAGATDETLARLATRRLLLG